MNAHSKNGSRGARSRTPKLSLYYYLSATFRIPWNVCEELRPQNLLKMNGIDCDLLGEVRKPSRAFAISWEKIANHRVHLRSPERRSQTIACICDLLGEDRKRSRAFAISWEKIANHRVHLRSLGRRSQTIACICDLLGEDRKRSRAFAISWEKIANDRAHLRSLGRRSQTVACDFDLTPPQTANCSG